MKKKTALFLFLTLLASSTLLSSQAISQNQERGYVNVNANSFKEISPDLAEISFAVQTSDVKSMQEASAKNKEISDKIYTTLASMLDAKNGDYIKTTGYNASPVYSYKDGKRFLDRYEVSNRVFIHTKNIDKIGAMIDKAISSGATNVDSLNFSVSNYDTVCDELLLSATRKVHDKAKLLVGSISSSIDGIRTMDSSCSANNYNATPRYYAKNMLYSAGPNADMVESSSTSINSGAVKINANVNMSFFVK